MELSETELSSLHCKGGRLASHVGDCGEEGQEEQPQARPGEDAVGGQADSGGGGEVLLFLRLCGIPERGGAEGGAHRYSPKARSKVSNVGYKPFYVKALHVPKKPNT